MKQSLSSLIPCALVLLLNFTQTSHAQAPDTGPVKCIESSSDKKDWHPCSGQSASGSGHSGGSHDSPSNRPPDPGIQTLKTHFDFKPDPSAPHYTEEYLNKLFPAHDQHAEDLKNQLSQVPLKGTGDGDAAFSDLKGAGSDSFSDLKGSGDNDNAFVDLKGAQSEDSNQPIGAPAIVGSREPQMQAIQARIGRSQHALRELIKSATLDAEQRDEWDTEAEESIRDAKLLSLDLSLDLIGMHISGQLEDANAELRTASRHAGLNVPFAILKDRRDELETINDLTKVASRSEEVREHVAVLEGKRDESTLEILHDALHNLPGADEAGPVKDLTDSIYSIYREGASFLHLATFNDNAKQYLVASGRISQQITNLVKKEQAMRAGREPSTR